MKYEVQLANIAEGPIQTFYKYLLRAMISLAQKKRMRADLYQIEYP